jgi:hypothetical protein
MLGKEPGGGRRRVVVEGEQQVAVERGIGRGELGRPAERRDGFRQPALLLQRYGQLVEGIGGAGGHGRGFGEQVDRLIELSLAAQGGRQRDVAGHVARRGGDGLSSRRDGVMGVALVEQRLGKIAPGLGVARPQADRFAERRLGLRLAMQGSQDGADVVVQLRLLAPERQRPRRRGKFQSSKGCSAK